MAEYYAGIGSRETPVNTLKLMTEIAKCLYNQGYCLRSGGARGADQAFEAGAGEVAEIFFHDGATPEACDMAASIHPAWHRCGRVARLLHGRNCMIILGRDLKTPVEFVVCWLHPEATRGGTLLGVNLAKKNGIPVYNLALISDYEQLLRERVV